MSIESEPNINDSGKNESLRGFEVRALDEAIKTLESQSPVLQAQESFRNQLEPVAKRELGIMAKAAQEKGQKITTQGYTRAKFLGDQVEKAFSNHPDVVLLNVLKKERLAQMMVT